MSDNQWEMVLDHDQVNSIPPTYRLRVEGGWLYRVGGPDGATTFVPDSDHPTYLRDEYEISVP